MSPLKVTLIILAVFIVLSFLLMQRSNAERKKRTFARLKKIYGTRPEIRTKDISSGKIPEYSLDHPSKIYTIDDITWNDLDMDGIYSLADSCLSSPGEEILYSMMRNLSEEQVLKRRSDHADYFDMNEDARIRCQYELSEIGKKNNSSLYREISLLSDAPMIGTGKYLLLSILSVIDIIMFVIYPMAALFGLMILIALDIIIVLRHSAGDTLNLRAVKNMVILYDKGKDIQKSRLLPDDTDREISEVLSDLTASRKKASMVLLNSGMDTGIIAAVLKGVISFFHLDLISYNGIVRKCAESIDRWLRLYEIIGETDAEIAIASFRKSLPVYTRPVFKDGSGAIAFKDIYHPEIEDPVSNSLETSGGNLVTGSNASGKSTFLKAVGIAQILSGSIYTAPASSFVTDHFETISSMSLKDDLQKGDSYFIAELRSVKRIADEIGSGKSVLCIIDEVLRGTNTIERIAASSSLLEQLTGKDVVCFAATHDRELTYILENKYRNLHFEENVTDGDVRFDYIIKEGRADTRNAVLLMKELGFDGSVIDAANEKVKRFETTGRWV